MIRGPITRYIRLALALLTLLAAAVLTTQLPVLQTWRAFIPIVFAVLLVVMAAHYGLVAAIVGAPLVALVFAFFMYSPIGSFRVESAAARNELAWMMLASIVISFLTSAAPPAVPRK